MIQRYWNGSGSRRCESRGGSSEAVAGTADSKVVAGVATVMVPELSLSISEAGRSKGRSGSSDELPLYRCPPQSAFVCLAGTGYNIPTSKIRE